jgi:hypothetical protein
LKAANRNKKKLKAGMLGLGLDSDDGHTRMTRGDNFLLLGGSHDTHQVMQETAVKINEQLSDRGKRLEDVSIPELRDILHQVHHDIHGSW